MLMNLLAKTVMFLLVGMLVFLQALMIMFLLVEMVVFSDVRSPGISASGNYSIYHGVNGHFSAGRNAFISDGCQCFCC